MINIQSKTQSPQLEQKLELKPKIKPKFKLNLEDLNEEYIHKILLKSVKYITNPSFCEAMIIQLEARKEQLNPDFESYTPKRDRGD